MHRMPAAACTRAGLKIPDWLQGVCMGFAGCLLGLVCRVLQGHCRVLTFLQAIGFGPLGRDYREG